MDTVDESKIVIQPLHAQWYQDKVAKVDMLRLDLMHPIISGNKWFKLKHNLRQASANGCHTILTFGGAYSNHLIAAAAAAKQHDIKSIGIVRGAHLNNHSSPILQACASLGMELRFISHEAYKQKNELQAIAGYSTDGVFLIPEGGANEWGRQGSEDIATYIPGIYTHVCISVGSGTTFTGIRNALPPPQLLLGFAPMKNGRYLDAEIAPYLKSSKAYQLFDRWHFGGFGKSNFELIDFMNHFYGINNIPLDIVYTSKMMFGLQELINKGYFPGDAHILCVHTGGLTGNVSVADRLVY